MISQNFNCDKTETQIVTKLKYFNNNKTQKHKWLQSAKTQIGTKLKTQIVTKFKV